MSGCYTWEAKCLAKTDPCAQTIQATPCPETQSWFWILAAALGLVLIVKQ